VRDKDIAIVGLAFKLPGADEPEAFWQNLVKGKDGVRETDGERWRADALPGNELEDSPGGMGRWQGGFLDGIDRFDASYFGLSSREAACMGPMERLFLEVAVTALDTSGCAGARIAGSDTGVFAGASVGPRHGPAGDRFSGAMARALHAAPAMIANRVSHFLDLRGPSKTVDALCSSTLVAVHDACASLRRGECSMAVAGGVNVILSADHLVALGEMGVLSPSGRCRTFDEKADGFVPGEGAGAFVLKPLRAALEEGDMILGVVKGSAATHNGRTDNLMTVDASACARTVLGALEDAGVPAESVTFLEANGTGAPLGDAAEVRGLKLAYESFACRKNYCALGAVKTHMGHLEAASGVGALVKVLLCMKNGQIPGNLHFQRLNPLVRLAGSPFFVCDKLMDWEPRGMPRRAGINSCAMGGSNCHLVLEEPPSEVRVRGTKGFAVPVGREASSRPLSEIPEALLCLSAPTVADLKRLCRSYRRHLDTCSDPDIRALCATHNTGRPHFKERVALVAENRPRLKESLDRLLATPEDEWATLERVCRFADPPRIPGKKKRGALSGFLRHCGGAGGPEGLRSAKTTGIVFLLDDRRADTDEPEARCEALSHLKSQGVVPDRILGKAACAESVPGEKRELRDEPETVSLKGIGEGRWKDFDGALQEWRRQGACPVFVELGGCGETRERVREALPEARIVPWSAEGEDNGRFVRLVAELYAAGADPDFASFHGNEELRRVPLPPYPFQRKPCGSEAWRRSSPPSGPVPRGHQVADLNGTSDPAEVRGMVEEIFVEAIRELAGVDPSMVAPDDDLGDHGVDSIVVARILGAMESRWGVRVNPLALARHRTLSALADHVASRVCGTSRDGEGREGEGPEDEARVALEPAGPDHLEALRRWMEDPDIAQWLDPFFQRHITAREYGYFLRRKDKETFMVRCDHRIVGICGLVDVDRWNLSAEAWIVVGDKPSRARGIAFAAGVALCRRAFEEAGLRTLTAKIRSDNVPALSMVRWARWRKVGILFDSLRVGDHYHDRGLYQLKKNDFDQWLQGREGLP